jgi:hypothetical protein
MRRKWVIVGLVGLAALVIAIVVFWPRGPQPGLSTFKQVRVGMTLEEVNATVGKSPDHTLKRYIWEANDATLEVSFGSDGRAYHVLVEPRSPPTTP